MLYVAENFSRQVGIQVMLIRLSLIFCNHTETKCEENGGSANVEPDYWPRQNGDIGTGFTEYGGNEEFRLK